MFRKRNQERKNRIYDLVDEYLLLKRQGEAHSIEEYVQRHPDDEPELREALHDFEWIHAGLRLIQQEELEKAAEELPDDELDRAWQQFRRRLTPPNITGDLLKIVRRAPQALASLIFRENWQPVLESELGSETEEGAAVPPPSQERVLRLTSGSLKGAEVERTSVNHLVITLNRSVPEGSQLKLITETGEELKLPVVRPLDRQGRASYDLSGVSESPAFRLALVEGEGEGVGKKK